MRRDLRLDYIRVIGILLVIMAHTSLNNYVSNIRPFDVAMLVCVAGASYSFSKPITSFKEYLNYLKKRFIRLVIPVWLFLTFYFALTFLLSGEMIYSFSTMASTYLLLNGIGYVWIFRIMLMMALINPLLRIISDKFNSSFSKALMLELALLILNELLGIICIYVFGDSILFKIIKMTVCYFIGYGILSIMGMIFIKLKTNDLVKLIVINGVIVLLSTYIYGVFSPSDFKYPPMAQFICYGLFACILFYLLFSWKTSSNVTINKAVVWLSKYSLNVYLAHILVIFLSGYFNLEFTPIIHYLVIIGVSISITYAYNFAKERLFHGKC